MQACFVNGEGGGSGMGAPARKGEEREKESWVSQNEDAIGFLCLWEFRADNCTSGAQKANNTVGEFYTSGEIAWPEMAPPKGTSPNLVRFISRFELFTEQYTSYISQKQILEGPSSRYRQLHRFSPLPAIWHSNGGEGCYCLSQITPRCDL